MEIPPIYREKLEDEGSEENAAIDHPPFSCNIIRNPDEVVSIIEPPIASRHPEIAHPAPKSQPPEQSIFNFDRGLIDKEASREFPGVFLRRLSSAELVPLSIPHLDQPVVAGDIQREAS